MLGALLVYGLCILSGLVLERRLVINNLLKRTMLVFGVAAAQLMLGIELLSLWTGLTGLSLALAMAIQSGGLVTLLGWRHVSAERVSWATLCQRVWSELRTESKDLWSTAIVLTALALLAVGAVAGWLMLPFNDLYHFEMPRFWIQRHSVLPFPVNDPRVVTLSFLSEALQLPGYLYLGLDRTPQLLAIFGAVLTLWVIFSLARRVGASFLAAGCAAAIAVGYTSFALDLFHASAEMFLTGACSGASLIFLMDAYAERSKASSLKTDLGCSIFLFLMSCGAKNSATLIAPIYLVFVGWLVKSKAKETKGGLSDQLTIVARLTPSLVACGLAGLLCSGVAWNYVSNKLWFGRAGLPQVIRTTVSEDFRPRAIWTRVCRGAALLAYDTLWIPKSARGMYASMCEHTVSMLGGQTELPDDDGHNFSFKESALTPLKGLGLLGIAFFLPGMIFGSVKLLSGGWLRMRPLPPAAFSTALLVCLVIGAFVTCHLLLRWQAIGLVRLMFPFVVAGAPLAALLLELRWLRAAALMLLVLSSVMFTTFWAGQVSRRMGWDEKPPFKWIARLQNNHSVTVHYQWTGQAVSEFQQREDYSNREIYDKVFQGLRQPCTIGFIGLANDQCLELFGSHSQNRVVPLVDCRAEDNILEPPPELDYLIVANKFPESRDWAMRHGFEQIFSCSNEKGELVRAFQKVPLGAAQADHRTALQTR